MPSCRALARTAILTTAALWMTSGSAFASAGCDAVNGGAWNMTLSIGGGGYTPQLGFAVGEKLNISATLISGSGGVDLYGFNGSLASIPAPGTVNFTVTDPNDLTLAVGLASGSVSPTNSA